MNHIALHPANILLPDAEKGIEMHKWACVACDQYTSQPEYWQQADALVADAPSTLRLTLPEIYLTEESVQQRIDRIQHTMEVYLKDALLHCYENSYIYLQRTLADGSVRHGLIGMVDLEQYSYLPGSSSQIRATEGTVLERIPPRVKIRKGAPLELPHVMMLIDDRERTVIEPLAAKELPGVYDFPLMMESGSVKGFLVQGTETERIHNALQKLIEPAAFAERYHIAENTAPLLFAVGDGNHSLATAKACFEELKTRLSKEEWENHPARYALVEIVNLHDTSLNFEPIHRFVENTEPEKLLAELKAACDASELPAEGAQKIIAAIGGKTETIYLKKTSSNLPVGTLQNFLDQYLKEHAGQVDYIHGDDVAVSLSEKAHSISFLLPAMEKNDLFSTVLLDGVLPRKTFSMGHACDKRFYLEARKII